MFAYCRNNSVSRVDVSGTFDEDCDPDNPDVLNPIKGSHGAGGGANTSPAATGRVTATGTTNGSTGRGYSSMQAFKAAEGPAGQGKHWHHIVERCQIQKSGFPAERIHNTNNMISVEDYTHSRITGHYNSTSFEYTNGLSVRNWLAGQSFEFQYQYGINVIKEMGGWG